MALDVGTATAVTSLVECLQGFIVPMDLDDQATLATAPNSLVWNPSPQPNVGQIRAAMAAIAAGQAALAAT